MMPQIGGIGTGMGGMGHMTGMGMNESQGYSYENIKNLKK